MKTRAAPVSANSSYIEFTGQSSLKECLASILGVKGFALPIVQFAHQAFGPPSWFKKHSEPEASFGGSVYVPMCLVLSPASPLYLPKIQLKNGGPVPPPDSLPMNRTDVKTQPTLSEILSPAQAQENPRSTTPRWVNLTFNPQSFIRNQLRVATGGSSGENAVAAQRVRIVPAERVNKVFGATGARAEAYAASALRIVRLAHYFQRPADPARPEEEERCRHTATDPPSLSDAFVEATRSISVASQMIYEDKEHSRSRSRDRTFLGDALDKAVRYDRAGVSQMKDTIQRLCSHSSSAIDSNPAASETVPNPFLACVLECACYIVGSADPIFARPCDQMHENKKRDVLVVRGAAAVLGLESFRAAQISAPNEDEGGGGGPDPSQVCQMARDALSLLLQEPGSAPLVKFPATLQMLRGYGKDQTRCKEAASDARYALSNMKALARVALALAPDDEQANPSESDSRSERSESEDTDRTESDSNV